MGEFSILKVIYDARVDLVGDAQVGVNLATGVESLPDSVEGNEAGLHVARHRQVHDHLLRLIHLFYMDSGEH